MNLIHQIKLSERYINVYWKIYKYIKYIGVHGIYI
jgi:hypothetical protein